MGTLKVGDIVARRSYNCDILFRIAEIDKIEDKIILKGICYRIQADAPEADLILQSEQKIYAYKMAVM